MKLNVKEAGVIRTQCRDAVKKWFRYWEQSNFAMTASHIDELVTLPADTCYRVATLGICLEVVVEEAKRLRQPCDILGIIFLRSEVRDLSTLDKIDLSSLPSLLYDEKPPEIEIWPTESRSEWNGTCQDGSPMKRLHGANSLLAPRLAPSDTSYCCMYEKFESEGETIEEWEGFVVLQFFFEDWSAIRFS